jgi:hypothetical protein
MEERMRHVVVLTLAWSMACLIPPLARGVCAESPAADSTQEDVGGNVIRLPETVVTGRQDSMIGIAEAASQGTVGADQLQYRTLSRPGEVLETVPGLILTQHSGGGKANQYFLRGFNLDHGTDFASSVDGVPVNLPTHAHGQGYSDLNFMIPELVQRIDFRKGPYYADLGDFSSAGGADLRYFDHLPHTIAEVEGGRFGYVRGFYASSPRVGAGYLLNAIELFHEDGPWTRPDDYQKINGVVRYSQGDPSLGFDVTAMAYAGKWNSTDQIARRAVGESFTTPLASYDDFGRFDSLDPTDAGRSHRYSLSGEWHRAHEVSATQVLVYGFYYDVDLFSNFTYFLDSPQGDQFEQRDKRWVGGAKASHAWFGELGGHAMQNTVGLQIRSDSIHNGLYQTVDRNRVAKLAYGDGAEPSIRATTRADQIWEPTVAPWFENKTQWAEKVRSVFGLRVDYFHAGVRSHDSRNSGTSDAVIPSPKGSLIFGPWADTEVYLSGGLGYHSNDARGSTQHVDPKSGAAVEPDDLLVRTYGAEIGTRTTYVPGLQSTLAFWWLHIGSELVFEGDAGSTAPSAPSRRYGVELANYYDPNEWLTLDADFSFSHASFTRTVDDEDTGLRGTDIPEAVKSVIATGIAVHQPGDHGVFGELRLRYFGPRSLTVDGSVDSKATALLSMKLGYTFNEHVSLGVELFNMLDRKDHEIDYYYPSFIPGVDPAPAAGSAPAGVNDVHFKPVEPISVRGGITVRF